MSGGPRPAGAGFTLLEVVIAVTLLALLVSVLAMAVRTGVSAWSRVRAGGEAARARQAVENLFGRQLRGAVRPGVPALAAFRDFRGRGDECAFVTTAVPAGPGGGGLARAVYRYVPERKVLVVGLHPVTRAEDLQAELPADADAADPADLAREGWIVG
ncbi:prepilin-type N-terminal cleavage/methylation domain-containing protein, partial [Dissulfurirhabdus thermomarina]